MLAIAIVLSVGAVLRHSFHLDIWFIASLALVVCLAIVFGYRTVRALWYGVGVALLIIFAAYVVLRNESSAVPKTALGERTVTGTVLSVNKRLDDIVVDVRDSGNDVVVRAPLKTRVTVLPNDTVTISGVVLVPQDFLTDTGRLFPYQQFLDGKGIDLVMQKTVLVSRVSGNISVARIATQLRNTIAIIFATYIHFPFDGIVAGMVVGYQGGIPGSVQTLFRDTGVLHVLVLSGYNITLLANALMVLLVWVPFRIRSVVITTAVLGIVLVSGAGIAAVRAGGMALIALFATTNIRTYQPLPALACVYCVLFVWSPEQIFSDPGFHLSFLATFFMIAYLPKMQEWCSFIPKTAPIDLRELLVLAVGSPLCMLPYTMYFSGIVPVASPFANILLVIVTPPIMLAGVAIFTISLLEPLARIAGILLSWVGDGVIAILELCDRLPKIPTPQLGWWSVLGCYGIVSYLLHKESIMQFLQQQHSVLQQGSNLFAQRSQ